MGWPSRMGMVGLDGLTRPALLSSLTPTLSSGETRDFRRRHCQPPPHIATATACIECCRLGEPPLPRS